MRLLRRWFVTRSEFARVVADIRWFEMKIMRLEDDIEAMKKCSSR